MSRLILIAVSLLLVLPKLTVIHFVNERLWGDITLANGIFAIAQDLLVALLAFAGLSWFLNKPGLRRTFVAALLSGVLLILLILDIRVREVWLKPADFSLLFYGMKNVGDLLSGLALFFNNMAGFGLTFRKIMVLGVLIHITLWVLYAFTSWFSRDTFSAREKPLGPTYLLVGSLALITFVISLFAAGFRYHINDNIFVRPVVETITPWFASPENVKELVQAFEQKPTSLDQQKQKPRLLLKNVKPFKNIVIVIYESVRWHNLDLDKPDTTSPILARLSREGLLSKSYVSLPHSSKAYYAIITGRHPYPGIEMKEVLSERYPSIFHQLKSLQGIKTYVFSSLFLAFENMDGLLKSVGFDVRLETRDMVNDKNMKTSSFGMQDGPLYTNGARILAKDGQPFAALFFPVAAHYPYACPGVTGSSSYAKYRNCVAQSDKLLGEMMEAFKANKLLKDTLFVIVGDHGESFGEHGRVVHNTSMYEEEVSIPLLFWSADGRLKHKGVIRSRQIDIAPTIADLMGTMDLKVPVQGHSLLRNTDIQPTYMTTFFDNVGLALLEYPHKYIYEPAADNLIYFDLSKDPLEKNPTKVTGPTRESVIKKLKSFRAYQRQAFP